MKSLFMVRDGANNIVAGPFDNKREAKAARTVNAAGQYTTFVTRGEDHWRGLRQEPRRKGWGYGQK